MEFLENIITEIKFAREKRKEKKKKESLEKFFNSPEGEKYLEGILKDWHIEKIMERKVLEIDNNFQEFRLAVKVDEKTLQNIIHEQKPKVIKYRITHQDDTMDTGDLLIEINDKVAIKTFGIIFPQTSGVKGVLSDLAEVYRPEIKDYPGFQPWREFIIKNADKEKS